MKKCLTISIIMILIIGILGGVVNASSASITPSSKNIELGDTITITVSFGQKVSAAKFTLNFDSSKLEYISYSCGGSGLKDFSPNGKKVFAYAGTSDDISSVSFTFKAKTIGTTGVKANNLLISTGKQSRISVPVGNSASITVKEKQTTSNNNNNNNNNNNSSNSGNSSSNSSTANKGNSSNKNTNKNNNKTTSSTTNKITTNTTEEKQETESEENVKQPAPNELIKLENKDVKTIENSETGMVIKALPVAVDDGIVLDVKATQDDEIVNKILNDIKGNKRIFDIRLLKDNVAVQPNGYVTVAIPIPEEFNKEHLELYYIDKENEKYELIQGEVQGEYYTFTTDHFSTYVLLEREEATQQVVEQETVNQNAIFYRIIAVLAVIIIVLIIIIIRNSQDK